jgi:hypothetical protein
MTHALRMMGDYENGYAYGLLSELCYEMVYMK